MSNTGSDHVIAFDWGDRICLNRVGVTEKRPENRLIINLSAPTGKLEAQLYTTWRKWNLAWATQRVGFIPKRHRNVDGEADNQMHPGEVAEIVDVTKVAGGSKRRVSTRPAPPTFTGIARNDKGKQVKG